MHRLARIILLHRSHNTAFIFVHLSFCQLFQLGDSVRSQMCSFVSFYLLFIASRLLFTSAVELYLFYYFIFIVSSFFLQWSAFLSVNSVSIFITIFKIRGLVDS